MFAVFVNVLVQLSMKMFLSFSCLHLFILRVCICIYYNMRVEIMGQPGAGQISTSAVWIELRLSGLRNRHLYQTSSHWFSVEILRIIKKIKIITERLLCNTEVRAGVFKRKFKILFFAVVFRLMFL